MRLQPLQKRGLLERGGIVKANEIPQAIVELFCNNKTEIVA